VWEYFTYDSSTDRRFCRVRIVDCSSAAATSSVESPSTTTKFCGHAIANKYPTNLRTHLKNSHPLEYKELLQKDDRQKASLVSGEEYTTISSVIPIVMKINLHLEEMKKLPEWTQLCQQVCSQS